MIRELVYRHIFGLWKFTELYVISLYNMYFYIYTCICILKNKQACSICSFWVIFHCIAPTTTSFDELILCLCFLLRYSLLHLMPYWTSLPKCPKGISGHKIFKTKFICFPSQLGPPPALPLLVKSTTTNHSHTSWKSG